MFKFCFKTDKKTLSATDYAYKQKYFATIFIPRQNERARSFFQMMMMIIHINFSMVSATCTDLTSQ